MSEAIVLQKFGDSSVLRIEEIKVEAPGSQQLRIRQSAIGVNFHDIYVRSGLYNTLQLPGIPGCEAAGEVLEVGEGVMDFNVGQRVAYVTGPPYGAYATERLLPVNVAAPIPDDLSDEMVAGNLLRAMTADMLVNKTCQLRSGMTVLVHAAAGGVGRLLCQMASRAGATVIGTVGTQEKAQLAKALGCTHPILYREVDFAEVVQDITNGKGVDVVYDSVGIDTFKGSMAALARRGHLINFGQSSGPVEPVLMASLAEKSLTISRPILFHYLEDTAEYQQAASSVMKMLANCTLSAEQPDAFTLSNAAGAHDFLESRKAKKSVILTA